MVTRLHFEPGKVDVVWRIQDIVEHMLAGEEIIVHDLVSLSSRYHTPCGFKDAPTWAATSARASVGGKTGLEPDPRKVDGFNAMSIHLADSSLVEV